MQGELAAHAQPLSAEPGGSGVGTSCLVCTPSSCAPKEGHPSGTPGTEQELEDEAQPSLVTDLATQVL